MNNTTWALLCAFAILTGCQTAPNLRVGIISDTQSYPGSSDPGQKNLREALNQLKEKDVDVILYAGDVSDNGNAQVYREYQEIVADVFPDNATKPEFVVIMGNHDYWNDMAPVDAQKNFTDNIGQDSINVHKVVKGYDFIGISPEEGAVHGVYTPEKSQKFFHDAMEKAIRRAPDKPVFVVTHQHAKDTVYGSDGWGNPDLTEMFKPYPQLVHFSGHSHFVLSDERSIFQKDFTSVGTSSLSYCELAPGRVNGPVPPHAEDALEYLVMDVFDDHLDFHRYELRFNEEIKADALWSMKLPADKETFTYTSDRADKRSKPFFAEGAKVESAFDAVPFSNLLLTFDAAEHDDFVESYAITFDKLDSDGNVIDSRELLFFSDFYRSYPRMSKKPTISVPAEQLEGNTSYHVSIVPVESFGKRGDKALTLTVSTPEKVVVAE